MIIQRLKNRNKPPLKVYWWRYRYPEKLNFGDEITPYIIEAILGRKCEWTNIKECEIAGAGSILEILQRYSEGHHIKVWGSGFIKEGPPNGCKNLDFYAVRGPSSLGRVQADREIALGDPGILSNLAFKPSRIVSHKVGIVFHYIDRDNPALERIKNNPHYKLIDPLQTPEQVVRDITSCEFILSSSLHGLIVADSFKVPNYWMPLSDKVAGGDYKFNDYYASTNRKLIKQPVTILTDQRAIDEAAHAYRRIENLRRLQKELIKSFPF